MNISESELEKVLRLAPSPKAPAGLKELLIAEAPSLVRRSPEPSFRDQAALGWLRRWWPAFAPTMVSLACAVVLTVQQRELRELNNSLQSLSARPAPTQDVQATGEIATPQQPSPDRTSAGEQAEIERLKQATLQSFLYAIRNRDLTNFFQAFTPEGVSQLNRKVWNLQIASK